MKTIVQFFIESAKLSTASSNTTLCDLNDDCLELIFENVSSLNDQLQVARVSQRFIPILERIWRRNSDFRVLCFDVWSEMLPTDRELSYFLGLLQEMDIVKALRISNECLNSWLKDYLEEFKLHQLNSVQTLTLEYTDCFPADEEITELAHIIPNARILYITAAISGGGLVDFKELRELHLYDDNEKPFEIQQSALEQICLECRELRLLDIRQYEGM